MRSPSIGILIGLLALTIQGALSASHTKPSLPVPTSETIPYVAEVLGASSYEETVERDEPQSASGNKRVQRKLTLSSEGDKELDPEYQEYQGNKTSRVMGRPGVDFPVLPQIPRTDFSCRKVKNSGYYADLETGCQVFHICDGGRKISFLCPNGTIFRQSHLICDWWFRVDCERSVELYEESAEHLAHDQMIYQKRTEEIAKAMKIATTTTERPSYRTSRRNNGIDRQPLQTGFNQVNQISGEGQVGSRDSFSKGSEVTNDGFYSPTISPQNSWQRQAAPPAEHQQLPPTNIHTNVQPTYDQKRVNHNQAPVPNSNPTAERIYQQADADFSQLGLTTSYPQAININDNSKLTSSSSQSVTASVDPPNDLTNHKVFSNPYAHEKERQVFAETASFVSNRHRFGNQLDSGYYPDRNAKHQTITTTTSPRPDQIQENIYTSPPPYATKLTHRGSQYYQTSAPFSTTPALPTTTSPQLNSQAYNSHMQPYAPTNRADIQLPGNGQPTYTVTSSTSTSNTNSVRQQQPRSSTSKPRRKVIFDVKIKPEKNYSLIELHRQYPTTVNLPASSSPTTTFQAPVADDRPPIGFQVFTPPTSSNPTPTGPALVNHLSVPPHQYAMMSIEGRPEEIRPEIVNSLVDGSIKPTSANALHTFASYFGSGEANDQYESYDSPTTTTTISPKDLLLKSMFDAVKALPSIAKGADLPSELSQNTKDSYSFLFHQETDEPKDDLTPKESGPLIPNFNQAVNNQLIDDKPAYKTPKPTTTTTARPVELQSKFRDSSELRELAQVFSRALSAYLEDPVTFKEILAQVRPTEPSLTDATTPNPDDEVLDFSDSKQPKTTESPVATTIFSHDDVTGNFIADKSHSLSPSSSNLVEVDSSTASSTPVATSVPLGIDNSFSTVEDTSYFPTAGSIGDNTRPRYGGFHNNSKYSPYGADLLQNVTTGTPITEGPTTMYPSPTTTDSPTGSVVEATTFLPAAQQVNNLISSHSLLIYGTSPQFTSSSEEQADTSHEQLLETSGSQGFAYSNRYATFGESLFPKGAYSNYPPSAPADDSSAVDGSFYNKGELLPYFGQEPPPKTISEPSAFQNPTPHFGDKLTANDTGDFHTQASANSYSIESSRMVMSDRIGTAPAFDPTEVPDYQRDSWAATTQTHDELLTTISPPVITYRDQPELSTIETTTLDQPTTTSWDSFDETTTTTRPMSMEEKAKEMFGGLNETAASMLMEVMSRAESNDTIRRLVLLLVNDPSQHRTAEESRSRLIDALLTRENEVAPSTTSAPTYPKKKLMKITRVRAGSGRSLKISRGVDTQTAIAGVNSIHNVTSWNTANAAKLYIPSGTTRPTLPPTTSTTTTTTTTTPPPPTSTAAKLPYDSDARALELLKTLYNLAAKWG